MCIELSIEYESAADAEKTTGITRGNIPRALKTKGTAGGFHWQYVDEEQ